MAADNGAGRNVSADDIGELDGMSNTGSATVFLDFDGVLHPSDVYLVRGTPVLRRDGLNLFEWAPLLEQTLLPFLPRLNIVLSTTWVGHFGREQAASHLPVAIRERVVGATYPKNCAQIEWIKQSRFQQIVASVIALGCGDRWVAVDDDTSEWDPTLMHHLVEVDGDLGLAQSGKADELIKKIEKVLSA